MCCALCSKMKTAGAGLAGRPGPAAGPGLAGPAGTQRSVGEPSSSSTSLAGTPLPRAPPGSCRCPRRRISATSQGNIGSVVRRSRHDEPTYHSLKRFSPAGAGCGSGSGSGSRGWESGPPSPRFSMAGPPAEGAAVRARLPPAPGAAGGACVRPEPLLSAHPAGCVCGAAPPPCLPVRGQPAGREGRQSHSPSSPPPPQRPGEERRSYAPSGLRGSATRGRGAGRRRPGLQTKIQRGLRAAGCSAVCCCRRCSWAVLASPCGPATRPAAEGGGGRRPQGE